MQAAKVCKFHISITFKMVDEMSQLKDHLNKLCWTMCHIGSSGDSNLSQKSEA